jgi:hypothetical protein
VLIAGPRQAGKTTLVRRIAAQHHLHYLTLDDEVTLVAAREDPVGLLRDRDYVVLDEVQRAPTLLSAIKKTIDEDRRPGRFLLTGSANLMALPTVAESLAGRMETLRLLPLSQAEVFGASANWVDAVFRGHIPRVEHSLVGNELQKAVLTGGYPEMLTRDAKRRRKAWARQYMDAIIQRDVQDIADVDKLAQMPALLRALAHHSGHVCSYNRLGNDVGLTHKSAERYVGILENMFLLNRVSSFATNRLKRIVKASKIHLLDSGLLATLLNMNLDSVERDRGRFGNVLETFVYGELRKHIVSAEGDYELLYYRDHDGYEVDFIIENAAGELVGIEVKSKATIQSADLRGLKRLAARVGPRLKSGILLYDGTETFPLGEGYRAAPLSTLWGEQ